MMEEETEENEGEEWEKKGRNERKNGTAKKE